MAFPRDPTPNQLKSQFLGARSRWGAIIDAVEIEFGFPQYLMYAIGSRETDLNPYYARNPGDKGNGHGIWQIDKRYHSIPADWRDNIEWQARKGAEVIREAFEFCGSWVGGLARYNSGACRDSATTGKDYGRDTWSRREWLQANYPTVKETAVVPGTDIWMVEKGQRLPIPLPPCNGSGGIKYGDIVVSLSAVEDTEIYAVIGSPDGWRGLPGHIDGGIKVPAGRKVYEWLKPGDEVLDIANDRGGKFAIGVLFEVAPFRG